MDAPKPARDPDRPYSIAKIADRWDCSQQHVRKLIERGELPAFRIGRLFRVNASAVRAYEKIHALEVCNETSDDRNGGSPDPFSGHELLHTTHVLGETVDRFLLQHSAIDHFPVAKEHLEKALDHLHDAYQHLGKRTMQPPIKR